MKSLILVLAFASFLYSQDSIPVIRQTSFSGSLTTQLISYSINKAFMAWQFDRRMNTINYVVSSDMIPYIARDSASRGPMLNTTRLTVPYDSLPKWARNDIDSLDGYFKKQVRKAIPIDTAKNK
jgi:hypothetical protein